MCVCHVFVVCVFVMSLCCVCHASVLCYRAVHGGAVRVSCVCGVCVCHEFVLCLSRVCVCVTEQYTEELLECHVFVVCVFVMSLWCVCLS